MQVSGRGAEYSTKVQQRSLTAASKHNRQHTELAGATAKRPAAPLVRDEKAAGSNPATRKQKTQVVTWLQDDPPASGSASLRFT
jgi:hypothetical protein